MDPSNISAMPIEFLKEAAAWRRKIIARYEAEINKFEAEIDRRTPVDDDRGINAVAANCGIMAGAAVCGLMADSLPSGIDGRVIGERDAEGFAI